MLWMGGRRHGRGLQLLVLVLVLVLRVRILLGLPLLVKRMTIEAHHFDRADGDT